MTEHRTLDSMMKAALRDLSWGAVPPSDNVKSTVWCEAHPFTSDYQVHLSVRVTPRERFLYLGGDRSRAITTPLDTLTAYSKGVITSRDIRYASSDDILINMIADAVKHVVRQAAPQLYEADPRIGSCDRSYPPLPLFDPPNGVDAMRLIPGCSLCGNVNPDPQGAGYRAWGGGNLGWVHPSCLSRVYP